MKDSPARIYARETDICSVPVGGLITTACDEGGGYWVMPEGTDDWVPIKDNRLFPALVLELLENYNRGVRVLSASGEVLSMAPEAVVKLVCE